MGSVVGIDIGIGIVIAIGIDIASKMIVVCKSRVVDIVHETGDMSISL